MFLMEKAYFQKEKDTVDFLKLLSEQKYVNDFLIKIENEKSKQY